MHMFAAKLIKMNWIELNIKAYSEFPAALKCICTVPSCPKSVYVAIQKLISFILFFSTALSESVNVLEQMFLIFTGSIISHEQACAGGSSNWTPPSKFLQ